MNNNNNTTFGVANSTWTWIGECFKIDTLVPTAQVLTSVLVNTQLKSFLGRNVTTQAVLVFSTVTSLVQELAHNFFREQHASIKYVMGGLASGLAGFAVTSYICGSNFDPAVFGILTGVIVAIKLITSNLRIGFAPNTQTTTVTVTTR